MLRAASVSARLRGTRDELFSILADYGRYAEWLPGVELSGILTREGDVAVVELKGSRFSGRTFNLELIQSVPEAIVFRQIDSLDRPEISGEWRLGKTEPDLGSPTALVHLSARVETPLLRLDSHRRIRSALSAGLDALGARRRHLAAVAPDAAAHKQKVLEIVRESGGLKVWYLGETFRMPKESGT